MKNNYLILDLAYRNIGLVICNNDLKIIEYGVIKILSEKNSKKNRKDKIIYIKEDNYFLYEIGVSKKRYSVLSRLDELEYLENILKNIIFENNIKNVICELMTGSINAKASMLNSLIHAYCFRLFKELNLNLYYIYEKLPKREFFDKKKVTKREVMQKVKDIYSNKKIKWFNRKNSIFNHIADSLLILEYIKRNFDMLDKLKYEYSSF